MSLVNHGGFINDRTLEPDVQRDIAARRVKVYVNGKLIDVNVSWDNDQPIITLKEPNKIVNGNFVVTYTTDET